MDGLGVSFLYAPVVERELAQGTLARFDLADTPMSGAFYFACLKDNLFARTWADWLGVRGAQGRKKSGAWSGHRQW